MRRRRMPIQFITGSQHKFQEINAIVGCLEQLKIDLPEIQGVDPKPIIEAKLERAMVDHHRELIVEDTSLFLQCLPGLPGPLIKWFMQTQGRPGLWRLVDSLGFYEAEARTTIGYTDGSSHVRYFEGSTYGTIVAPRGDSSFGWDPLFVPEEGDGRTYAEMTEAEKNAISHRGKAARAFKAFLDGR